MSNTYESLKVFISSPGDVSTERDLTIKAIGKINSACRDVLGLELEPVSWNDFIPKAPPLPNVRIQNILNEKIPECQIFLLILWRRYGSVEPRHSKSNTQREVEVALKVLRKNREEDRFVFLSYFRDIPLNEDKGPQEKSVIEFRNSLQKKGIWFKPYREPEDFKMELVHDLVKSLLEHRMSTKEHKSLRKFWILGTPNRQTQPKLAIIYPSMERNFMGIGDNEDLWLNRLEPNIVFEDFKALEKITNTLRIVGCDDFRIYNSSNMPVEISCMNRFWICLRNKPGIQWLKKYDKVSRFEIVPKQKHSSSYMKWKNSTNKEESITVRSPLSSYLKEQRSNLSIDGEWLHEMDHIIAKDYAVLSRFRNNDNAIIMKEGHLHDYFLAGLRGLGTWGAAWFIDRKCRHFGSLKENEDMQLLLEVEYQGGRIYDVRDVSDREQEYFNKENSLKHIRKTIQSYSEVAPK